MTPGPIEFRESIKITRKSEQRLLLRKQRADYYHNIGATFQLKQGFLQTNGSSFVGGGLAKDEPR